MRNLHFEPLRFFILVALVACALCSCNERKVDMHVSLDAFAELRKPYLQIDEDKVSENIRRLALADRPLMTADRHARTYYLEGGRPMWLSRKGADSRVDSVLKYVAKVDSFGFSREDFCYTTISRDLARVQNLDFDTLPDADNGINRVYARLEYSLTKAFLRYCEGQRFGFTNPYDLFNRLDVRDSDSVHVSYRSLYGVPTKLARSEFLDEAYGAIASGSEKVGAFMQASYPENPLYSEFCKMLSRTLSAAERRRVFCNIERSRWRHGDYPQLHDKYVLVNVPTQQLEAVEKNDRITMRIALGSMETKTPLLNGRIKRIDFNPQWIIPKSIIKTSVRHHAGDVGYFERHNYFVRERKSGKIISPAFVTADMMMSHDYHVVQRGGKGNALGRIIFRFDNGYSIYLHDTSSPSVFANRNRIVSHGCIRVERPYDLAVFMLADKDERVMEKMKYSIAVDLSNEGGEADDRPAMDKSKLLHSLSVKPTVPLFITYYTLYPNADGVMTGYDDIYGFDPVIYAKIQNFIKQ